jgi:hypothetical protein
MRPFVKWAKKIINKPNQSATWDLEDRSNGWTVRATVIKHPEIAAAEQQEGGDQ